MASISPNQYVETELQDLNDPRRELDRAPPRADGGIHAWLFLTGCFMVEGILWGLPFSYGVFQEYYRNYVPFAKHASGLVVVGTSASGVMYLGSPVVFMLLKHWPGLCKLSNILGLCILVVALVTASFAKEVWHLILTQGILYGIGGALSYCPCILYLNEWFLERRGLAFGIMWAGTGVSGLIMPFVTEAAIDRYGFRTVLRAFAVAFVILLGPLVRYLKPRIPLPHTSRTRSMNFHFLFLRTFWIYQIPNVIQGLGYFIPALYLPSYANLRGMPSVTGPLTVALFNAALVGGSIVLGAQTDRHHVTTIVVISTIGAAAAVLILWGISVSTPAICVFSVVYGFFAGAYSTCWTAMVRNIQRDDTRADTGLVFGMFLAGRGVGNLVSGPVSESLLSLELWSGELDLAYGSGYGILILFVGATAFLGGVSWIAKRIDVL